MWLGEFYKLFPEASALITGHRQDLGAVEHALARAQSKMRVGQSELQVIEGAAAWSYRDWWPPLNLGTDVELPKDLRTHQAKRKAVETLHDRLKYIEVVSVVLRFLCPEEFGILSPPVASLLIRIPTDNHIDDYMRYLEALQNLRSRYGHHPELKRLAHIDMALWVAAHHSFNPQWAPLKEEMDQDQYFQELRLRNLMEGLGKLGPQSDQQRLLLARVIAGQDCLTAALIAARSCEGLVSELARRIGVYRSRREGHSTFSTLDSALSSRCSPAKLQNLSRSGCRTGTSIAGGNGVTMRSTRKARSPNATQSALSKKFDMSGKSFDRGRERDARTSGFLRGRPSGSRIIGFAASVGIPRPGGKFDTPFS